MKKTIIGIMLIGLLATSMAAYGCVGARPLAMGGAFIGLADDANATYWNPAGLAQMAPSETMGTWMHTSNNRDEVNYQDFGSLVGCAEMPRVGKMSFGASYVREKTLLDIGGSLVIDDQDWVWASVATDLGKLGMFGVNVRQIDDSAAGFSVNSDIGVDLSYLYKVDSKLTLGVLAQDINEPDMEIVGFTPMHRIQNWRVGMAYRPQSDVVVTVDGYDLANNGNALSARFGFEKKFGRMAVRGGYYGLGDDTNSGPTFGVGFEGRTMSIDATMMAGDLDNTIMISGSYRAF